MAVEDVTDAEGPHWPHLSAHHLLRPCALLRSLDAARPWLNRHPEATVLPILRHTTSATGHPAAGDTSATVTVALAGPGTIFRPDGLTGPIHARHLAEAREPSDLCLMTRNDVRELLLADPRIATGIASISAPASRNSRADWSN